MPIGGLGALSPEIIQRILPLLQAVTDPAQVGQVAQMLAQKGVQVPQGGPVAQQGPTAGQSFQLPRGAPLAQPPQPVGGGAPPVAPQAAPPVAPPLAAPPAQSLLAPFSLGDIMGGATPQPARAPQAQTPRPGGAQPNPQLLAQLLQLLQAGQPPAVPSLGSLISGSAQATPPQLNL